MMSVKEMASPGDIVAALRIAGRKVYALRVLEMDTEITDLRAALAKIKTGVMHQRRFGVETLGAWRSAAIHAEGVTEDALALPDNAGDKPTP
jgi:hypothetical protein